MLQRLAARTHDLSFIYIGVFYWNVCLNLNYNKMLCIVKASSWENKKGTNRKIYFNRSSSVTEKNKIKKMLICYIAYLPGSLYSCWVKINIAD